MPRHTMIAIIFLLGLALPVGVRAARPNVLMIFVDDLGYGDLGCYGAPDLESPHIDDLAARGVKLTNFYANCPVCSPSRAALLSGRYPELVGVPGVIRTHPQDSWGYLRPDAAQWPTLMQQQDYQTALIGKWHLGLTPQNHPLRHGFDFFHGFLGDMMDDYYHHRRHGNNYMRRDRQTITPEGHATDLFSDWACEYLQRHRRSLDQADESSEHPFFLYLAYNAPHTPIQPPGDWLRRVQARQPSISPARARLVALIEHLDEGIGRVMKTLRATNLAENTLVIFSSDNGGQSNVGANNAATRAGKGTMYEGGIKVPTIAVWQGHIPAGSVCDEIGMTMDLFPTVCQALEVASPERLDGRSLLPALQGDNQPLPSRDLFWIRREGGQAYGGLTTRAMRRGPWKLVQNSPYAALELYRLDTDPMEENNLIGSQRKIARDMAAALRRQIQRGGTVPWQPTP